MQQRIHTQVCRLNRGSLSWTELQLGNCKLQEKNKIRKPRALLQSGPTSQLTYSLRGEYIFQSPWAINLNTPRCSTKDMKRERAPWTKEDRLPCSVYCALGLWAPENTSASLRGGAHSTGVPDGWAGTRLGPAPGTERLRYPSSYPRQCGTADKSLCHARLAAGRGSPDKACLYHWALLFLLALCLHPVPQRHWWRCKRKTIGHQKLVRGQRLKSQMSLQNGEMRVPCLLNGDPQEKPNGQSASVLSRRQQGCADATLQHWAPRRGWRGLPTGYARGRG